MFYFTCVDLISPLDEKCFKAESTSYHFYYPLSACPSDGHIGKQISQVPIPCSALDLHSRMPSCVWML